MARQRSLSSGDSLFWELCGPHHPLVPWPLVAALASSLSLVVLAQSLRRLSALALPLRLVHRLRGLLVLGVHSQPRGSAWTRGGVVQQRLEHVRLALGLHQLGLGCIREHLGRRSGPVEHATGQ